jgi:hypothetical protein
MKSVYNRITGWARDFVVARHLYVAGAMLALMFGLGISSMAGNSAIVDEVAHIPAAYSYLHYGDYRLNPEHPPLIKDLAGLPLQFMHLKFPDNRPAWTDKVNGQWEAGWDFLYHLGNDADAMLLWARLPIVVLAVGFGASLYWFCRRRWGTAVALMTLFFYCLSPNLLAHSTVVTTDLGASVFIFLAIATFARFTDKPHWDNVLLLSLALAGAQLAKFSSALLYPLLGRDYPSARLAGPASGYGAGATQGLYRPVLGGVRSERGVDLVVLCAAHLEHAGGGARPFDPGVVVRSGGRVGRAFVGKSE